MNQPLPKLKLMTQSVYVLVEEGTKFSPNVECKFVTEKHLPDTGNYFVLTQEGILVHKDNTLVNATLPVKEIKSLGTLNTKAKLKVPRIPGLLIARSHEFFQKVWNQHKSEAEVMLMFHKKERTWEIWCPEQTVSGGSVHYKTPLDELDRFRKGDQDWTWAGTIHSHCNFSAYHSGVDTDDEHNVDGVHITLGHVDQPDFSASACVVVNGWRFPVPPGHIATQLKADEERAERWKYISSAPDQYFRVVLDDKQTDQFYDFYEPEIKEWVAMRVKKETYAKWKGGAWT